MAVVDSNVDLNELSLDVYSDIPSIKEGSEETENNLTYPCAVIMGITTTHEIEFLKNHSCDMNVSLPLYIDYEGLTLLLGKIELTMDYMLLLRCLDVANRYTLSIHKSKEDIVSIDLSDPATLMKFIRI